MECLASSDHPKAVELRKAFSVENSATPEGFIFTDNGCTDLERKGIKGVYRKMISDQILRQVEQK